MAACIVLTSLENKYLSLKRDTVKHAEQTKKPTTTEIETKLLVKLIFPFLNHNNPNNIDPINDMTEEIICHFFVLRTTKIAINGMNNTNNTIKDKEEKPSSSELPIKTEGLPHKKLLQNNLITALGSYIKPIITCFITGIDIFHRDAITPTTAVIIPNCIHSPCRLSFHAIFPCLSFLEESIARHNLS